MSGLLHWLDQSLQNACEQRGNGTVQRWAVSCETCKASDSFRASSGDAQLQEATR